MSKPNLLSVFQKDENAYPNSEMQSMLSDYSQSVNLRLAAFTELESVEKAILDKTCERIFEKYPKVEARVEGYEKTHRDMALILRYCGQAMLRNDMGFLEDRLLYWLATMLQAFKFGDNCLRDSYDWLDEETKQRLQAQHYELLQPYLQSVKDLVPEKEESAA